jgi:hypothetical protein
VDPITATMYAWTFQPPFDHVLKDCSYFGQTMRSLEARTKQHKTAAAKDHKDVGLHALWLQYPYDDHWHIRVLQSKLFADRVEACNWMNCEEKRLIKEHGGVLKSMDERCKQTLNLTSGGQANPRAIWEGMLAYSRKKLMPQWAALQKFYEDIGHLRVPQSHPVLGTTVACIRNLGTFLQHSDFKAWLNEHGFIYDERRAHLELDIWPAFKKFYEENKHLRVPTAHPALGSVVSHIRTRKDFLHYDDFRAWLDEHRFVYDEPRAHLEQDIWPALKKFQEQNGHLRVPTNHPSLGNVVRTLRRGSFHQHDDFRAWLDEHRFVYDEPRAHLEQDIWPAFNEYYKENKHLRVPYSHPVLGRVAHKIRTRRNFLHCVDFKTWLDEHEFDYDYDQKKAHLDLDIWPAFKDFYEQNKHLRVPTAHPALGSVVNNVRTRRHFLQYDDFAMWLWSHCFQMHTKDAQLNRSRWESVFATLNQGMTT